MPFGLENVGQYKTERRVRPDFLLHCVLCFRGTQQGSWRDASTVKSPGVTRFHEPPVHTYMEFLRVLKRAPRSLEHRTLGIRLREARRQPPSDCAWGHTAGGATIQQTSRPGEVLNTNLNTCPFAEGKKHGSLLKCLLETHTKLCTRCNLILKTHDKGTMDRRSNNLRHLSARRIVARIGEGRGKGHFPMIACHPQAHNPLGHEEDVGDHALALARRCARRWRRSGTMPGRKSHGEPNRCTHVPDPRTLLALPHN